MLFSSLKSFRRHSILLRLGTFLFVVLSLRSLCLSYGEATTAAYRPWNVAIRRFIRFDTMRTCVLHTAYQRIQNKLKYFHIYTYPPSTLNLLFGACKYEPLETSKRHWHCVEDTGTVKRAQHIASILPHTHKHTQAKYAIWIDINNLLFCDLLESTARLIIQSSPSIVCLFSPTNRRNEIKQMSVCHFCPKMNKFQLLRARTRVERNAMPATKQCALVAMEWCNGNSAVCIQITHSYYV